ncbi:HK97 gp10 family phage protein [Kaustia mangrovi]|uniref:HK97 gp10 family phage protein n=1 Tax=Kaustia mangrovi TaxID=2593653 RepID=A0A7S8C530_9HYPH|nr:HK97-gp10 family putative phage morphogenesis protein [Kaustia mangrovi]QPC43491.1 HK97 gp10 family phage protein [Kaustia mangrovi]
MAVKGLDKLQKKLKALPDQVRKDIHEAMKQGAEELTQMQRRLAPVDSGALRDSIGYTFGNFQADNANVRGVTAGSKIGDTELSVTIHAGDAKAFYAAFVEFGTVDQNGQPYFFPAYRSLSRRIKGRISRATTKAAKKVAGSGK